MQRYDDEWISFGLAISNRRVDFDLSCRSKCKELLLSEI
jgi:hypothetical protein